MNVARARRAGVPWGAADGKWYDALKEVSDELIFGQFSTYYYSVQSGLVLRHRCAGDVSVSTMDGANSDSEYTQYCRNL